MHHGSVALPEVCCARKLQSLARVYITQWSLLARISQYQRERTAFSVEADRCDTT
jgi:hypothetical protein